MGRDISWDPDEVLLPFSITRDGRKDITYPNRHSVFPRFVREGGVYYIYLRVIANNACADNYCVDLEVTSNKAEFKLSSVRVYGVDIPWDEVKEDGKQPQYQGGDGQLRGGGVLAIPSYMAGHFCTNGGQRIFQVKFKVRFPSWP